VSAEDRTPAISDKSKVYALLSRYPAGLTPQQLALACLRQGLAVGEPETVAEHLMHILMDLEAGPVHQKVVRIDDGRYRVVPFW
jgi:hypothetical protein